MTACHVGVCLCFFFLLRLRSSLGVVDEEFVLCAPATSLYSTHTSFQMRLVALLVLCVALGEARPPSLQAAFVAAPLPPISEEELAEGARAAAADLEKHLEDDSGYGLLMQVYKQEMSDEFASASTGRQLLSLPTPALSNTALERLATRIITVLAGAVMKPSGTRESICGMNGPNHEAVMHPEHLSSVAPDSVRFLELDHLEQAPRQRLSARSDARIHAAAAAARKGRLALSQLFAL